MGTRRNLKVFVEPFGDEPQKQTRKPAIERKRERKLRKDYVASFNSEIMKLTC